MNDLEARLSQYQPQMLAVLRIMTGLLFLAHGTAKHFGFPDTGMMPPLFSLIGLAGVIEIVGGTLIVLGLFTRIAAFITSGEMAVAYFMVHAPISFFPILNDGIPAVLYCFIFLYLVFAGAGAWSIDAQRAGQAGAPAAGE
jgi:putative oxidoreductase